MYYRYNKDGAYRVKNQYIFGGTLIVAPITSPMDKRLNLSKVKVWLPKGKWTDIFNGRIYEVKNEDGDFITMHRDIDAIPVLAPAGAIIPTYKNAESNDLSLTQPLSINVYSGNGSYVLYEDDGETDAYRKGQYRKTEFTVKQSENKLTLTVKALENGIDKTENERVFTLKLCDIKDAKISEGYDLKTAEDGFGLEVDITLKDKPITVVLTDIVGMENENYNDFKNAILTRIQGKNKAKEIQFKGKMPKYITEAINEIKPK
jgi:alpha-glucosidase (family GH31 glycosyl hydrolase)